MEDYELTLFDRIEVIKKTIEKYGENNFYISFSGGKDSTILHYLVDMAIPKNNIPRVFIDTGIEYLAIKGFVSSLAINDSRFITIKPENLIIKMLQKEGYPFKSKEHSVKVNMFQKGSNSKTLNKYINGDNSFSCPKKLKYQFSKDFNIPISDKCCYKMKKEPIKRWEKENNRHIAIIGTRMKEGGERKNHKGCVVFKGSNLLKFKPLNPISDEFEKWFIENFKIKLCDLYYPPYNFERTGCKGCPYNIHIQNTLDILEKLLPNERKQCELIWKPIYEEYRRIGYRLKKGK